jgi:hypothetical protein
MSTGARITLAVLLLATAPVALADPPPRHGVGLRLGLFLPVAPLPEVSVEPDVAAELSLARDLTPWLDLELTAGLTRAASRHLTVFFEDPSSPSGALTPVDTQKRFTTVPLVARLRVAWPERLAVAGWVVRPYLAAGGGAVWAQEAWSAPQRFAYSGWGAEWNAGLGAELRAPAGTVLGLEARWRAARVTLRHRSGTPTLAGSLPETERASLGGGLILAQAGWRF